MRCPLPFLLLLLLNASAFPQGIGVIQCEPESSAPVPAFSAPGMPHVVEQLKCGQKVRVLGLEKSNASLAYSLGTPEYAILEIAGKAAYVDARYVKISESKELSDAKTEDAVPVNKSTSVKESEEQKKWSVIAKESVTFREERLLQPITLNGQTYTRTFRAVVGNESNFPISQLQLLVRIYDCSGRQSGSHSNCDIIGEAKVTAASAIPPHQTRRVEAVAKFESIPSGKSNISWNYKILGIRAE